MKALLLVLLLIPQLAAARVYMCVDPATGKTVFTDKGCATWAASEEVRIQATNLNSGTNTAAPVARKAWVSDRDTRKTGRDYSAQWRESHQSNAIAQRDSRYAPPTGLD